MVHSAAISYDIWPAEKMLKAMKFNSAFWRFVKPMLDDGGAPPPSPWNR